MIGAPKFTFLKRTNQSIPPPSTCIGRLGLKAYMHTTQREKKPRRGAGKALVLKIFNVHFFIVIFIFNWKSRDKYLANACKRILTSFD